MTLITSQCPVHNGVPDYAHEGIHARGLARIPAGSASLSFQMLNFPAVISKLKLRGKLHRAKYVQVYENG